MDEFKSQFLEKFKATSNNILKSWVETPKYFGQLMDSLYAKVKLG